MNIFIYNFFYSCKYILISYTLSCTLLVASLPHCHILNISCSLICKFFSINIINILEIWIKLWVDIIYVCIIFACIYVLLYKSLKFYYSRWEYIWNNFIFMNEWKIILNKWIHLILWISYKFIIYFKWQWYNKIN